MNSNNWAYDFECDLPILAILVRLNEAGPWNWVERDNEAFGTYISAIAAPGVRVRIYDLHSANSNGPRYTADFRIDADNSATRAEIDATFVELLSHLPARGIVPGEYYD